MDLHLQTMESFLTTYHQLASQTIRGRYQHYDTIATTLSAFSPFVLGKSVKNHPIQGVTLGNGPIKILMWSQMHGNESTSTKGLLDVMCFLQQFPTLLTSFTLKIIPLLNPDGAIAYTRVNANLVDLNRDALDQSQPESKILIETYKRFNPDYCFNLHDQRTIFGVNGHPCMLSFLAPAADETKSITPARTKAMGLIGYINQKLQAHIPNQVGRYNDSYNPNCMGDYFMAQGTPTVLFECGQVGADYAREETRKWFGFSLLNALVCIAENHFAATAYDTIPEVEKSYVDVLLHNATFGEETADIALQYLEKVQAGKLEFIPMVHSIGVLRHLRGHKTIDLSSSDIVRAHEIAVGEDVSWLADLLNLTQYSY